MLRVCSHLTMLSVCSHFNQLSVCFHFNKLTVCYHPKLVLPWIIIMIRHIKIPPPNTATRFQLRMKVQSFFSEKLYATQGDIFRGYIPFISVSIPVTRPEDPHPGLQHAGWTQKQIVHDLIILCLLWVFSYYWEYVKVQLLLYLNTRMCLNALCTSLCQKMQINISYIENQNIKNGMCD